MIKKITLSILAIFSIIFITQTSYAYQEGTNVLINPSYTVTYTSVTLAGSTPTIKISIAFNGDAIGYDTVIINGIYQVSGIYDTSFFQSGIGQGYSPQVTKTDYQNYYLGFAQPILRPSNVVKTFNNPINPGTVIDLHYFYNPTGDNFNQAVSQIKAKVSIILLTSGGNYVEGYEQALIDTQLYYETLIEQILENTEYDLSVQYDLAKNEFGIFYNGQWYNAIEWGNIRYQEGINANPTSTPLAVMFNGLASIFGVGLAFILQLGSIELMGISLNMILGIGLLLVGLIAVLGLIFGGKWWTKS